MGKDHKIVLPGQTNNTLVSESGETLIPPEDWAFLPAGDAAITKSVKSKGRVWVVQVRRGRRVISKGIWACKADIVTAQQETLARRSTPEYARQRKRDLARQEARQEAYVDAFFAEVVRFLDFHPRYQKEAGVLGKKITAHAAPVNSGTVARTQRIPIARRAQAAVIAWMRHQTTAYDSMLIPRVKGKRREVRRALVLESMEILNAYRQGRDVLETCPLKKVLG
jgi:hypothetical protein